MYQMAFNLIARLIQQAFDSRKCKEKRKEPRTHHIGNPIELEQLNRTHDKWQTYKQSSHSAPTNSWCYDIFLFTGGEQITAWMEVWARLARASTPLQLEQQIKAKTYIKKRGNW